MGAEAALVKGRNESCELDVVLHVLTAAREEEQAALSRRRSLLIRGAALGGGLHTASLALERMAHVLLQLSWEGLAMLTTTSWAAEKLNACTEEVYW